MKLYKKDTTEAKNILLKKLKEPKNINDLIAVYKSYTARLDQKTIQITLILLKVSLETLLVPHDIEIFLKTKDNYIKEYYDNNLLIELIYYILKLNINLPNKILLAKKYFEITEHYSVFTEKSKQYIKHIFYNNNIINITNLRDKNNNSLLHQATKYHNIDLALWLYQEKNLDPLEPNKYNYSSIDFALKNKLFLFLAKLIPIYPGYFGKNENNIFKIYGENEPYLNFKDEENKKILYLYSFANYEIYKIKNPSLYKIPNINLLKFAYAILGDLEKLSNLQLNKEDFLTKMEGYNILQLILLSNIFIRKSLDLKNFIDTYISYIDLQILEDAYKIAINLNLKEESQHLYQYITKEIKNSDAHKILQQAYINYDLELIDHIFNLFETRYDELYLVLLGLIRKKLCLDNQDIKDKKLFNKLIDVLVNKYYSLAYSYEKNNIKYNKLDDINKILSNIKDNSINKNVLKRILSFVKSMNTDINSIYRNNTLDKNLHLYYLVKSGNLLQIRQILDMADSQQIFYLINNINEYGNNILHSSINYAYFNEDDSILSYLLEKTNQLSQDQVKKLLLAKSKDNITTLSMAANYKLSKHLIMKMLKMLFANNQINIDETKLVAEIKFYLKRLGEIY